MGLEYDAIKHLNLTHCNQLSNNVQQFDTYVTLIHLYRDCELSTLSVITMYSFSTSYIKLFDQLKKAITTKTIPFVKFLNP